MDGEKIGAAELAAFVERMGKQLGLADQKRLLEDIHKELKQIRGILGRIAEQKPAGGG